MRFDQPHRNIWTQIGAQRIAECRVGFGIVEGAARNIWDRDAAQRDQHRYWSARRVELARHRSANSRHLVAVQADQRKLGIMIVGWTVAQRLRHRVARPEAGEIHAAWDNHLRQAQLARALEPAWRGVKT